MRAVDDKCGTRAGYQRHRAKDEKACDACLRANRESSRKYRPIKRHPHAKAAGPMVIDVLSTYTEWMTLDTLIGRVQLHQPSLSVDAITRAVYRLKADGRLMVRERFGALQYYTDEWSSLAS